MPKRPSFVYGVRVAKHRGRRRSSQDAAPSRRITGGGWLAGGAGSRSPSADRRAARLHPQPSGRGARPQPLDLHPARPTVRRRGRDAMGSQANPRRRVRAASRRAETKRDAAPETDCSRSSAAGARRGDGIESAASGLKARALPRIAAGLTAERDTDRTRRHTVVAFNHSLRPGSFRPVCARSRPRQQATRRLASSVITLARAQRVAAFEIGRWRSEKWGGVWGQVTLARVCSR